MTDEDKLIDEWNEKYGDTFVYVHLNSIDDLVLDGQFSLNSLKTIVTALEELHVRVKNNENNVPEST